MFSGTNCDGAGVASAQRDAGRTVGTRRSAASAHARTERNASEDDTSPWAVLPDTQRERELRECKFRVIVSRAAAATAAS